MKKIYSILFCLMAMSITFTSCSKGGDDDFLPNGGGTEVNEKLTDADIVSLNNAYNSGYTTTFINALESKGCIAKPQPTRSGVSDAKYELTDKGKEYFGHDMFSKIDDLEMAYDKMCLVFQGYWYDDNDDNIKHDTEYKWVSLDNPNNDYFEFSNNGVNYHSCLIIKNPRISNEEYRIYKDPDFDIYKPTYIKGEDGEFKLPFQNDGGLIFSHIRGTKEIVSKSYGGKCLSPKDNNCIMHVSTFRPEDWGLYIRVPKTNK